MNQLGNVIRVGRDMLCFTGTWGGATVTDNPFALLEHRPEVLRWANYECSGTSQTFECVNPRNGEMRLYRRLQ